MCGRQRAAVECRPRSRATSAQTVASAIVGGSPGKTVRLGHGPKREKGDGCRGNLSHAESPIISLPLKLRARSKNQDNRLLHAWNTATKPTINSRPVREFPARGLSITRHTLDQMAELAERLEGLER